MTTRGRLYCARAACNRALSVLLIESRKKVAQPAGSPAARRETEFHQAERVFAHLYRGRNRLYPYRFHLLLDIATPSRDRGASAGGGTGLASIKAPMALCCSKAMASKATPTPDAYVF